MWATRCDKTRPGRPAPLAIRDRACRAAEGFPLPGEFRQEGPLAPEPATLETFVPASAVCLVELSEIAAERGTPGTPTSSSARPSAELAPVFVREQARVVYRYLTRGLRIKSALTRPHREPTVGIVVRCCDLSP